MANRSSRGDRLIDRRIVVQAGAALAAAVPVLLRGEHPEAQPRPRTIIDSQVHAYEANTPQRPWFRVPNWPPHVTGDEMVAAMDKVGVDGAIFVSPFSMYQYDASYAVEVQKAHPGRFALVKPVNPDDPAVADRHRRLEADPGHRRHSRHIDQGDEPRAGRPRPRPDLACGGSPRFSRQHPVLGQPRRGHGADRASPR